MKKSRTYFSFARHFTHLASLPGLWNGGIMSNEEKMGVIDMSSPP